MVKVCVIRGCSNESYPGCNIPFHNFPKNEELKQKWLDAIPNSDRLPKCPAICGRHFKPTDYIDGAQFHTKKILRSTAVPSIFPTGNVNDVKYVLVDKIDSEGNKVGKYVKLEAQEMGRNERDLLSLDLLLSVDRNEVGNQLMITLDPTVAQNVLEAPLVEHNYALPKCDLLTKQDEIKTEMNVDPLNVDVPCDDDLTDAESVIEDITRSPSPATSNEVPDMTSDETPSAKLILTKPSTNELIRFENRKLKETCHRQMLKIEAMRKKIKALHAKVNRSKTKVNVINENNKFMKVYTSSTQIDNILNRRYTELCKLFDDRSDKQLLFSSKAMKFAITLYYISPHSYQLVRKYIKLPNTKIIKKYLAKQSCIIDLSEFDED